MKKNISKKSSRRTVSLFVVVFACVVSYGILILARDFFVLDSVYQDNDRNVGFRYPNGFAVESHAGHSDFQGDFFVYDIGKQEYLQSLASTDGISGSGGVPVWLRLVVSDGIADGESCGERKETGRIRIAGHLEAVRCEGTTMGDLNSVWFVISASGKSYIYSSDVYEGDDRRLIDKIVKSTVLMTK